MTTLLAFRIINFRSIVDSGWVRFSTDGITVLVGQNESGKTSVLEALHCALNSDPITLDDMRIGKSGPVVHLKVQVSWAEIADVLQEESPSETDQRAGELLVMKLGGIIDLKCDWVRSTDDKGTVKYPIQFDLLKPGEFAEMQTQEIERATAAASSHHAEQDPDAGSPTNPPKLSQSIGDQQCF